MTAILQFIISFIQLVYISSPRLKGDKCPRKRNVAFTEVCVNDVDVK